MAVVLTIQAVSAEDFILVGFAGTAALQLLLSWILRRPWGLLDKAAAERLSAPQVAVLSGGHEAAVDAVLIGLVAKGQVDAVEGALLASSTAKGSTVEPIGRGDLEQKILAMVERTAPVSLRDVRRLARDAAAATDPTRVRGGYELGLVARRTARAIVALPAVALGVASITELTISRDGPPFLTALAVAAVLMAVAARLSPITTKGERALAYLRSSHSGLQHRLDADSAPRDIALAFALVGPTALPAHLHGIRSCIEALGSRIRPTARPGEKQGVEMRARW